MQKNFLGFVAALNLGSVDATEVTAELIDGWFRYTLHFDDEGLSSEEYTYSQLKTQAKRDPPLPKLKSSLGHFTKRRWNRRLNNLAFFADRGIGKDIDLTADIKKWVDSLNHQDLQTLARRTGNPYCVLQKPSVSRAADDGQGAWEILRAPESMEARVESGHHRRSNRPTRTLPLEEAAAEAKAKGQWKTLRHAVRTTAAFKGEKPAPQTLGEALGDDSTAAQVDPVPVEEEKTLAELFPKRAGHDTMFYVRHLKILTGGYDSEYGRVEIVKNPDGALRASFEDCGVSYPMFVNRKMQWKMNGRILQMNESTLSKLVWRKGKNTSGSQEPMIWTRGADLDEDDSWDLGECEASFDAGTDLTFLCLPTEKHCTEKWHRDGQAFAVALGVDVVTGRSLVAPRNRPATGIQSLPPAAIANIMEFVRGFQLIHFKKNDKVTHATHGAGKVTEVERLGTDTWVTVVYDDGYTPIHPYAQQAASAVLTLTGRMTPWKKLRGAVKTSNAFKVPAAKAKQADEKTKKKRRSTFSLPNGPLQQVPEGVIQPASPQATEPVHNEPMQSDNGFEVLEDSDEGISSPKGSERVGSGEATGDVIDGEFYLDMGGSEE